MTKNGQDLYFDEEIMHRPNHSRVERMLHEMQLIPHENLRHLDSSHQQEHRANAPSLLDWDDSPSDHRSPQRTAVELSAPPT